VLYVAAPVKAGDAIVGVVTVAKPTDSFTLFLDSAQRGVISAGLLVAVAIVALGAVLSLWITRPIERLTRYAKDIRDGLRPPPPHFGGGEIGALGNAFEEMRDALEGKKYVENYVQTLTHEMKSPLSAIRGAAELLQENMPAEQRAKFLDNIVTETARMRGLVDRLLLLSTLENRKELHDVEDVALAGLIDEVAESLAPQLAAKDLTLTRELQTVPAVACERFLVRHALANLLQNAIDFSPRGGRIAVRLEPRAPGVALSVADEGPGVPAFALPRVFERFYSLQRPDSGHKSSGLGLSIVREAAVLHGGSATLENREPGGALATILLPLRPTPRTR
jgi:two-component system sensor histidine kinase CreC